MRELLGRDQVFGQQMWLQAGSRVLVHVKEKGGGAALIFYGGFNKGTVLAEGYSGCHFPSILNTTPLLSLQLGILALPGGRRCSKWAAREVDLMH